MKNLLLILTTLLPLLACQGPQSPSSSPAAYQDIDLVGYWHREPRQWDAARFAPHVCWKAPDGSEHWLFQAFIFLEGSDWVHNKTLVMGHGESAGKDVWQYQLDLWLGADGGVAELDKACAEVAGRIGPPERKRGVIIGVPDAIMFQNFFDKTSSTTYWGDGLDFSKVEDRLKALRWYMDSAREMFKALDTKYLELAGFYITAEEIYLPYDIDVNCRYKNSEEIIPAIADYCHAEGQGLYWIPYHMGPGYKYWKKLGIDQAWMQPNWYWDHKAGEKHPFSKTIDAIKEADMSGMELEFEFSGVLNEMPEGRLGPDGAGASTFTRADVPALQDRVRHYMQQFKDAGFYGKRSIALYSGSNALTQLATSPESCDRALYDDLCRFILGNRGELPVTEVVIDEKGRLQKLAFGGRDYAGGQALWRLYYNTPEQKEIQVCGADETPVVSRDSDTIRLDYTRVGGRDFELHLKIWTEGTLVRFGATVENNEPHTIIRELQYPLIGNLQIPSDYKLLTTHTGGQIFDNPVRKISDVDVRPLYMTPAQKFRQYDLQYPRNAAANCFAFVGSGHGLYFGSHDTTLQQTWHGLRTYPDKMPDQVGHDGSVIAGSDINTTVIAGSDRQSAIGGTDNSVIAGSDIDTTVIAGSDRQSAIDGIDDPVIAGSDIDTTVIAGSDRQSAIDGIDDPVISGSVIDTTVIAGSDRQSAIGHVTEDFKHLEAGFYRYPNAMYGDSWTCDASVVVPYEGVWTATSRIYRRWADTWWHHAPVPKWVQDMTGWQRIIFKHQYGEYLRKYTDLPGRIAKAGESVGCNAVLAFGWWKEGMDNGYPNYTIDDSQGGEEAWKEAIAQYRQLGNRLLLYFNGRLIDVESEFYRSGGGSRVANKDNTGREFTEHYKFTGEGTTLGYYDSRTFVIADMSKREWRDQLVKWADRAMSYGADAVFYDQLGVAEEFPNWDLSREYPVQDIFTGRYKAEALKEIRDHIKARNPEFALGTEWLSDCTSQFCDFVHIVEFTALPESFPEWFRYTFPEVVWSDRCVRDDNDVPRRVNNTLLKGLRNDIEVFRCRGLIDETPVYQEHLSKVNVIRHEFPELLLEGRYTATDGFSCSNPKLVARSYTAGDSLAVVVTNIGPDTQKGRIEAPGYKLSASRSIAPASAKDTSVTIGPNGLCVLIFTK